MNLLPAETLIEKQNHADSLGRKIIIMHSCLSRKQEIADILDSLARRRNLADEFMPCAILHCLLTHNDFLSS